MKQLQYVNLRFVLKEKNIYIYISIYSANNVTDPEELKKLAVLPMLRALVLLGKIIQKKKTIDFSLMNILLIETPLAETDSYRMEVLVGIEKLER
jgi:hypothetical protein